MKAPITHLVCATARCDASCCTEVGQRWSVINHGTSCWLHGRACKGQVFTPLQQDVGATKPYELDAIAGQRPPFGVEIHKAAQVCCCCMAWGFLCFLLTPQSQAEIPASSCSSPGDSASFLEATWSAFFLRPHHCGGGQRCPTETQDIRLLPGPANVLLWHVSRRRPA